MIRIILTITFIFFLTGCKSKSNSGIHDGSISEKEMRLIVADLMKADQFFASYAMKDTVSDKIKERYKLYQRVLDIHHVSKEKFWQNFSYYKKKPEQLSKLMDSIQKTLSPIIPLPDKMNKRAINDIDSITDYPVN